MPSQVITIERKKYATGLFWQPVAASQSARAVAERLSKFIPGRGKFFVEYKSMVGVGSRALGHRAGMSIAAAELSGALSEYASYAALFEVRQGFWLAVVRNGIILRDALISDAARAKEEFEKYATLPNWGILIAPAKMQIPRTTEKRLPSIVSGNSRYRLSSASKSGKTVGFIFLVVMLLSALYFFRNDIVKYLNKRPADIIEIRDLKPETRDLISEVKTQTTELTQVSDLKSQVSFCETLPDLLARATQCMNASAFFAQTIPGWTVVSAGCELDIARASFSRGRGNIAAFFAVVENKMPDAEWEQVTSDLITGAAALDMLEPAPQDEEMPADEVLSAIESNFQSINMPADIHNDPSKGLIRVAAASKFTPMEFIRIFDGISCVDLEAAKWDNGKREWNYEVAVYVK